MNSASNHLSLEIERIGWLFQMTKNNCSLDTSDKLEIGHYDGANNNNKEDVGHHEEGGKFKSSQERETNAQRRARILSIYIVHIGMFIFSLGFSIVLTGVYPYMKQVSHVGI